MSNIPFIDIEGGGGGLDIQLSGPLIVQGISSQTADLQQWQSSTGTVLGQILYNGSLGISAILPPTGIPGNWFAIGNPITLNIGNPSYVGQVIKGAASQTADLQQWQSSTGSVLAKVDASGNLTTTVVGLGGIGNTGWGASIQSVGAFLVIPGGNQNGSLSNNGTTVWHINDATPGAFNGTLQVARAVATPSVVVKGLASQTADLMQLQDSAAHVQLGVANAGTGAAPVWSLRIRALANAESMGRTHTLGAYSGKSIQVLDDLGATVGWIPLYA